MWDLKKLKRPFVLAFFSARPFFLLKVWNECLLGEGIAWRSVFRTERCVAYTSTFLFPLKSWRSLVRVSEEVVSSRWNEGQDLVFTVFLELYYFFCVVLHLSSLSHPVWKSLIDLIKVWSDSDQCLIRFARSADWYISHVTLGIVDLYWWSHGCPPEYPWLWALPIWMTHEW